jgi:molybdopterin-guanine dinucleotide biosynthesis protein B
MEPFMPIPILSIVGKKNCGKTTLLEKLIPELKRRGHRVGTIKHDTHGFDIDHEGKDTFRHKAAGADVVAISCPWKVSVIKDVSEELTPDQLVKQFFGDVDIVLTEGYKREGLPQVEVFRREAHHQPIHAKERPDTLIALVSDVSLDLGVPYIHLNDVIALADLIENRFLRNS